MSKNMLRKVLFLIALPIKCYVIFYLILYCVDTRRILGFDILLKEPFVLNSAIKYNGIEDRYSTSNFIELNNNATVGISGDYIYGDIGLAFSTKENVYFVIDVKAKKIYKDKDIAILCNTCGLDPKLFESTYPITFYYHYNRIRGGYLK